LAQIKLGQSEVGRVISPAGGPDGRPNPKKPTALRGAVGVWDCESSDYIKARAVRDKVVDTDKVVDADYPGTPRRRFRELSCSGISCPLGCARLLQRRQWSIEL